MNELVITILVEEKAEGGDRYGSKLATVNLTASSSVIWSVYQMALDHLLAPTLQSTRPEVTK